MNNHVEGESRQDATNQQSHENGSQIHHERPDKNEVIRYIQNLIEIPLVKTIFEADLEKLGLVTDLEDLGVLPIIENPNPNDPYLEEEKYEDWWDENNGEEKLYRKSMDKRTKAINCILVGSLLGNFFNFFVTTQAK